MAIGGFSITNIQCCCGKRPPNIERQGYPPGVEPAVRIVSAPAGRPRPQPRQVRSWGRPRGAALVPAHHGTTANVAHLASSAVRAAITKRGTCIKAVLSDDEGMGQKAHRNPACIMPRCDG
jgi:hypothetical protein